jgi:hypothetical protein
VRLKVTVKKWEEMRQSIDLNGKKSQRGTVVTVMFHDSFCRFGDLRPALPVQFGAPNRTAGAALQLRLAVKAVASASHPLLDAEWLHTFVAGLAEHSKISSWVTFPRSSSFLGEGISNSSCEYAAHALITNKSEQRCCAAA